MAAKGFDGDGPEAAPPSSGAITDILRAGVVCRVHGALYVRARRGSYRGRSTPGALCYRGQRRDCPRLLLFRCRLMVALGAALLLFPLVQSGAAAFGPY